MLSSIGHIIETISSELLFRDIVFSDYPIDHICYRCISNENYDKMKNILINHASLLKEGDINGRLISIRRLSSPLTYNSYTIPCIELASPKLGSNHKEGREHIEVIVDDLEEFDRQYSHHITERKGFTKILNRDLEIEFHGLNSNGSQYAIKFHEQSIEEVIKKK